MNDLDERLLPASQILAMFSISDMALWRWLHDDRMNFPQPHYIGRRRYWKASEIEAFRRRKEEETAARRAQSSSAA